MSLTQRDAIASIVAGGIVLLAGWAATFAPAGWSIAVVAGAGTSTLTLLVLNAQRRLAQLGLRAEAELEVARRDRLRNWQQVEAYVSLVAVLRPRLPLPRTREWVASPDALRLLAETVLARKPRLVVEASSGTSTLVIAYCLERNGGGRVVSLEHDEHYAEGTRQLLRKHGLQEHARIIVAPLVPTDSGGRKLRWYALDDLQVDRNSIDVLFVDGPPAGEDPDARYPALPLLIDRMAPDGVIIMDDGSRPGERSIADRWHREFGTSKPIYMDLEKGAYVITLAKSGSDSIGAEGE